MKKRLCITWVLVIVGIALVAVTFYWHLTGERKTDWLLNAFEQRLEEIDYAKEDEKEETTLDKKNAQLITEGEVIGTIEIESIGIRCPIIAGTNDEVLNKGIGYLMETAPIGSVGNCVLAGHNGSRYGKFFTDLNQVEIGSL